MRVDRFVANTPIIKLKQHKLQDRYGKQYKLKFPYSSIIQNLNSYAKSNNLSFDELKQTIINKNIITEFTLNNILSNNELYCIKDLSSLFEMMNMKGVIYMVPINSVVSIIEKRDM